MTVRQMGMGIGPNQNMKAGQTGCFAAYRLTPSCRSCCSPEAWALHARPSMLCLATVCMEPSSVPNRAPGLAFSVSALVAVQATAGLCHTLVHLKAERWPS